MFSRWKKTYKKWSWGIVSEKKILGKWQRAFSKYKKPFKKWGRTFNKWKKTFSKWWRAKNNDLQFWGNKVGQLLHEKKSIANDGEEFVNGQKLLANDNIQKLNRLEFDRMAWNLSELVETCDPEVDVAIAKEPIIPRPAYLYFYYPSYRVSHWVIKSLVIGHYAQYQGKSMT